MAATVVGTLNSLVEARNKLNKWDCGNMEIVVATSLTNDALVTINFSNLIGHNKRVPRLGRRNDDHLFWLHPDWRENLETLREKDIIPFFVESARQAGAQVTGSWEKRFSCIVFVCIRGRRNNPHKNKEHDVKR